MLIDQNYNVDNICKIIGQKQIIYTDYQIKENAWVGTDNFASATGLLC
jgi:hypothetical protein